MEIELLVLGKPLHFFNNNNTSLLRGYSLVGKLHVEYTLVMPMSLKLSLRIETKCDWKKLRKTKRYIPYNIVLVNTLMFLCCQLLDLIIL